MRKMFSKKQLENQTEQLLASGNLPSVKADEIIENMSGYSVAFETFPADLEIEPVYSGIVKNGNKLTVVTAFNITRKGDIVNGLAWEFVIPSAISSKLYPTRIGSYDYLSVNNVDAWASDTSSKSLQIYSTKSGSGNIHYGTNGTPISALTLNTKYYVRIENTFLLSENLIP